MRQFISFLRYNKMRPPVIPDSKITFFGHKSFRNDKKHCLKARRSTKRRISSKKCTAIRFRPIALTRS